MSNGSYGISSFGGEGVFGVLVFCGWYGFFDDGKGGFSNRCFG